MTERDQGGGQAMSIMDIHPFTGNFTIIARVTVKGRKCPEKVLPLLSCCIISIHIFSSGARREAAPKLPRVIRVGPNANLKIENPNVRIDNPYRFSRNLGLINHSEFSGVSESRLGFF